jgi:type IV secretory pathway TraG/TraD family ATPase VirD4
LGAAALLVVLLLPAVAIGGLLAALWSWRGWSPAWLLVPGTLPWTATTLLGGQPLPRTTAAVRRLLETGISSASLVDLLVAALPLSMALGSATAATVVVWQRLRAPSWRDSSRRHEQRAARRRGRRSTRRVASTVIDRDGQALVGIDVETGRPAGLPARMLGRHTLVVGSTGSGKTTTATRLAAATLEQGGGLLVVDLKGDPDTVTTWRRAASERHVTCHVWSFDAATTYDPLAAGGVAERTRKVMALAEWTEPYYADQAEQLLQLTLRAFEEVGDRPTLARLHATLTPDGLSALHRRSDGPAAEELAREAGAMSKGRLSALESLRTKLALLTQAGYGTQLDPDLAPDRPVIDLAAALDAGEVVVVSLDELSYGHIAARMAEVVLTDVAAAAGARLRRGRPRLGMVWVDEFSAMRPGPLASLFARVRSANLALLLSTQEVSDLDREDDTFRAAVATNVATVLAHRVHDPRSAEWISQLVGTRSGWQETSQVEAISRLGAEQAAGGATGLGTVREVEQYVVHPNDVKSLPDHHAYLARLDQSHSGERARRVRVVPLDRLAPSSAVDDSPAPAVGPDDASGPAPTPELDPQPEPDAAAPDAATFSTADHETDRAAEASVLRVPTELPGDEW